MKLRNAVALLMLSAGAVAAAAPAQAQWYEDDPYYGRRGWRDSDSFAMQPDPYYRSKKYRSRYGRGRVADDYDDRPRYRNRRSRDNDNWDDDEDDEPQARKSRRQQQADERGKPLNDEVRSGGPRPAIAAKAPPVVTVRTNYAPGTVVIDQSSRKLYYIMSGSKAYRYPISVGREGFSWTGSEKISRIADWPDWHPPAEMREREPDLPAKMLGGVNNPLGAKAIYLGNSLYRIHGTNNAKSIGQAASSGCFRMMNAHVSHLASLVQVGAQVHVLKSLPKAVAAAD